MKIRTDFVTNSSSSSFITVTMSEGILKRYLEEHGLEDIFDILAEVYYEITFEVELNGSFSRSLCNILRQHINECDDLRYDGDIDKEDIIELINFIDANKTIIDRETEGEIAVTATLNEDGFAYYQDLLYKDNRAKLKKWPYADGWSLSGFKKIKEFNRRFMDGEIEELAEYAYMGIWDLILDHPKVVGEFLDKEFLKGNTENVWIYELDSVDFANDIEKSVFEFDSVDSITIKDSIFVLTGFEGEEEEAIIRVISDGGGQIKSSTVLATNYLIVNEGYDHQTTKYKRAIELKEKGKPIKIISYQKFFELV